MNKKLALTLILIAFILMPLIITSPSVAIELTTKIDEIIQPLIDSGERVGIVVGIVSKEGIQTFNYGETVLDSGNQPDGETIFEIGSVTKTFTTLLLAIMVEDGEIDLEDLVENFLPCPMPGFDDIKITLLDLATHTSGLPRLPTNFDPEDPMNPYADYTEDLLFEFLSGYSLPRAPGESYEYSNLGVGLLGHALELEKDDNYENLVLSQICTPLSMDDTRIQLIPEQEQRVAQGYMYYEGNIYPVSNWDFDVLAPCGALRSSVNDMLQYLSANLGLIETDLLPAIEATHIVYHETGIPGVNIGLGWHTYDFEGAEIIWHNGATYGYYSYVGFIKAEGIGVVILSNTYVPESNSIDSAGLQIFRILRLANICPIIEIHGAHSEETELLRNFRDNVLNKTPEGQEIIRLYYECSPAIVEAMEEDEEFRAEVKGMIDGILLLIRDEVE